ncbi:MAG: hypothetical protein QXU06_05235 [Candidatus Bathyarchaeia archaeon]
MGFDDQGTPSFISVKGIKEMMGQASAIPFSMTRKIIVSQPLMVGSILTPVSTKSILHNALVSVQISEMWLPDFMDSGTHFKAVIAKGEALEFTSKATLSYRNRKGPI